MGHTVNGSWLGSLKCFLAGVLEMSANRLKADLRTSHSRRFTEFGNPPSGGPSAIHALMRNAGLLVFGVILTSSRLGFCPLVAAPGAAAP